MRFSRSGWLAVAAAALAALGSPAIARADAVIDWNIQAVSTITGTTPAPTAHYATLPLAMVHGAIYDAVNAIDKGHRPYLQFESHATKFDSQDAAAATAAFKVLTALYPSQTAVLQARYDTSLAAIPSGAAKLGGIAAGEAAAAAMLAARAHDGRFPTTPFPFVIGTTAGVWRLGPQILPPLTVQGQPVDPTPWVGNVTPFLVPDAAMLRTKGPNALTSRKYKNEFNEVKSLGSLTSTTRTADQTMAALFWQAQAIALYSGVMRTLSSPSRFGLDTAQNARLFGMVALSAADGAIGCWNDKYYWNWWRPIDAIRQGENDGNQGTAGDPRWLPLFDPATATVPKLVSPGFPDHPSGHSCVSGAALTSMKNFFHTDEVAYDVSSPRFPGQTRHFDRFSQNLQEIIDARVWGGIHFRTADEQGAKLGKKVARWERNHFFQPVGDEDNENDDNDEGGD